MTARYSLFAADFSSAPSKLLPLPFHSSYDFSSRFPTLLDKSTFQEAGHSKDLDEETGEQGGGHALVVGRLLVQVEEIEGGGVVLRFRF